MKMQRETYERLLGNSDLKEYALELFDIFEEYVDETLPENEEYYSDIRSRIDHQRILEIISSIYTIVNDPYRHFVNSLRSLINYFFHSADKSVNRFKKVLLAYINVSRQIVFCYIYFAAQNVHAEKCLLAISLVDLDEACVDINEEINTLVNTASGSSYKVFPIFGCSTDLFRQVVGETNPQSIHLAGHVENGKKIKLQFTDAQMTYDKLVKYTDSIVTDLMMLNCCYSWEFLQHGIYLSTDNIIMHEEEVADEIAYNFAVEFYRSIFPSDNVIDSYNLACHQEEPSKYHLVTKTST